MYYLYPNIVYKIKKTVKNLGLTDLDKHPEKFITKKKRFYSTICKTKHGDKVFFKSLLSKEKGRKDKFLNEINFYKALKENPQHPLVDFCPQLLTSSASPSFPYLVYKFIRGETRENKDKFQKKEIKEIVKIIKIINSSPINIFRLIPKTPLFEFKFYKKRIVLFLKNISLEKKTKDKIRKRVCQSQKTLYNVKSSLSHGDFSEANSVFYEGKIKLIDWEHVHLRNPLYDFTEFWLKRKKFPTEQKILKIEYLKNIKDKNLIEQLFELALLEICLRDAMLFENVIANLKKTASKETKTIKEMAWQKKERLEIINKIL